jgi:ribosome-associated translation inhibitor RaiA
MVWRAEVNLDSLGKRYNAKSVGETLQNAIDKMTHDLEAELRKSKTKEQNMFRRGGAAVKSFMRGFGNT